MGGLGRAGARRVAAVPRLGHGWAVRAGTVATVVLAACLALAALVGGVRDLAEDARRNEALGSLERAYGNIGGSPNAIRDPAVVEAALERIPARGTYAVVVGPEWISVRTPRWTPSLERDFLRYYLFPRRLVERPSEARWVVCLACEPAAFPNARVRARSSDGMLLLERP